MFSRSAAPLCRGGDPRTDPSNTVRSTSWRSMRLKAPETESHPLLIPEAPKRPAGQSAAPRCVHLLAPSVGEWLPERYLAHFIVEVIGALDLGGMIGAYRGSGSAAH